MISLTSLALALVASITQAPQSPPLVRTIPVPSPISTRPLSPEALAADAKLKACRQAFYGQTYLPQPPIYRLTDGDTTLYILGSVHTLPASFDWRSPDVDKIVAASDRLVTENGLESLPGAPNPLVAFLGQSAAPEPPSPFPPLTQRLDGERRAKWQGMAAVAPRYLTDWLDRQPDWRAAMTVLSFATRSNDLPAAGGVERQLRTDFARVRKPILALEQGKDVIALFDSMAPAVQRAMLHQSLDEIGQPSRSGQYLAVIHRWARGEGVVEPLESSLPDEFREALLDRRNAAWVPEIRKHLGPPGTRLVVVGAGHLTGRNNLVELLTAAGLKPERFSRTGQPLPRAAFTPQPKNLLDCARYQRVPPAPPPPPPPPPRAS